MTDILKIVCTQNGTLNGNFFKSVTDLKAIPNKNSIAKLFKTWNGLYTCKAEQNIDSLSN